MPKQFLDGLFTTLYPRSWKVKIRPGVSGSTTHGRVRHSIAMALSLGAPGEKWAQPSEPRAEPIADCAFQTTTELPSSSGTE